MRTIVGALLIATFCANPCQAQQPDGATEPAPVQWGSEIALSTAYLWRGEVDIDHATLQPEFWMGVGNWSITSWSALANGGLHEHDLSIGFERSVRHVALKAGWINYFLPGASVPHDNELFAGVEYSRLISPSVTVWHGLGSAGRYVEGAVSSRARWRRLSVEPKFAVGYSEDGEVPDSALHLESTLAITWAQRGVAIRPFVTHVTNLGTEGRHAIAGLSVTIR